MSKNLQLFVKIFNHYPRRHLVIISMISAVLMLVFHSSNASRETPTVASSYIPGERYEVSLDWSLGQSTRKEEAKDETKEEIKAPLHRSIKAKVKPGDSLSAIFSRLDIPQAALIELISQKEIKNELKHLKPGDELAFEMDSNRQIESLTYPKDVLRTFIVERDAQGQYNHRIEEKTKDVYHQFAQGTIESSLFLAGERAGLNSNLIMELANIFGWDIDFIKDIRQGDSFKVLYERYLIDGEVAGYGDILAAEFVNQGESYQAVKYEDSKGNISYYAPDGTSMRKSFLRSPLPFARVSSGFNLRRKHPVLHKIVAHRGTDYAAAHGTPIKAVGDGEIKWAARKGSFGKLVVIQHGQRYKSKYAHLSGYGRGIKRGKKVKQGQIIGYVGRTGRVTGTHLHYEFLVDGVHRNSRTVKLPQAKSIHKSERERFNAHQVAVLQQMNAFERLASL